MNASNKSRAMEMADDWTLEAMLLSNCPSDAQQLKGAALARCADRLRETHGEPHLTTDLQTWREKHSLQSHREHRGEM